MAFENPAAYIEVDPSGQLSSSGNEFIFTGLTRNADTYFYKDWGVGFWSGDFSFKFKLQGTGGPGGLSQHLTLANAIDDFNGLLTNAGENAICSALRTDPGVLSMYIYEVDGTSIYADAYAGLQSTDYWVNIKRVGTTLSQLIYSDEFITLVDTLSLALHNSDSFRYQYPIQSFNDGSASGPLTGFIDEIDLQLAAAFQAAWARNSNQIIGVSQ